MAANKQTRPFLPTLNAIRTKANPSGYDVAEALDGVSDAIAQTNAAIAGLKTTANTLLQTVSAAAAVAPPATPIVPDTDAFDAIASGTNTQALMTVGTGAVLEASGTGIINATEINGIMIIGTPTPGQIPIAQSATTAIWGSPSVQMIGPLTAGDYYVPANSYVLCDASEGDVNLNLPFSADSEGQPITVKLITSQVGEEFGSPAATTFVNLIAAGGSPPDLINYKAFYPTQVDVQLTADGVGNWWIFGTP